MTKFENIGVERQQKSISLYEADRNFNISCTLCCHYNMRIDCDRCAIAVAHEQVIAIFADKEVNK